MTNIPLTESPIRAIAGGELLEMIEQLTVDDLRVWVGRLEDATDVCRAVLRQKLQQKRRQTREAADAD
jgi:hypothetical protein